MRLMFTWSFNPTFAGLFPDYGQIAHLLRTRAPVATQSIATPVLPLDLHVLGLSLAFILSQDQTLRCKIIYILVQNTRSIVYLFDGNFSLQFLVSFSLSTCVLSCTTSCMIDNLSMNICLSFNPLSGRKRVQRYCLFLN